jgi:hypothetical protein
MNQIVIGAIEVLLGIVVMLNEFAEINKPVVPSNAIRISCQF